MFYLLMLFSSCVNTSETKKLEIVQKSVSAKKDTTIFWKFACQNKKLDFLFDCNNLDQSYQVTFSDDKFKDYICITLNLDNEVLSSAYYTRFIDGTGRISSGRFKKQKFAGFIKVTSTDPSNPSIFYYETPKKIELGEKKSRLNDFFTRDLWNLKDSIENEKSFSQEFWTIKGRKNGREIKISHNSFRDSTFYTNAQMLIDICNIKDYKYVKPKK